MCSYREKKAEPVELLQLDGYTVDYTDPQTGHCSQSDCYNQWRHSEYILHLFYPPCFSIRACTAICSLKGRVFRFQLLAVILSVPKQAIMLFDFANWHLFIFFMYYCNYNHIAHRFCFPKVLYIYKKHCKIRWIEIPVRPAGGMCF